jgi:hypothetical protein
MIAFTAPSLRYRTFAPGLRDHPLPQALHRPELYKILTHPKTDALPAKDLAEAA